MLATLSTHSQLWKKLFWQTWEPLPFGEKLTWIAFVGQTIAIITLLEFLLLGSL